MEIPLGTIYFAAVVGGTALIVIGAGLLTFSVQEVLRLRERCADFEERMDALEQWRKS